MNQKKIILRKWENSTSLQYSCLKNPLDRGAWWATVYPQGHKESDTTEQLSTHAPIQT